MEKRRSTKNRAPAITNALYFSNGAQLAWLNDNKTASDEAIKTYDVLTSIGLVTDDFAAYDGVTVCFDGLWPCRLVSR